MKLKRSESDVLRSVRDLLKGLGVFHLRLNTGMFRNPKGQPVSFGTKGCADILALMKIPGCLAALDFPLFRPVWIELKGSEGRQSKAQKIFEYTVKQQGHKYLLIRSADELHRWIQKEWS